jgi:hypothetical protein
LHMFSAQRHSQLAGEKAVPRQSKRLASCPRCIQWLAGRAPAAAAEGGTVGNSRAPAREFCSGCTPGGGAPAPLHAAYEAALSQGWARPRSAGTRPFLSSEPSALRLRSGRACMSYTECRRSRKWPQHGSRSCRRRSRRRSRRCTRPHRYAVVCAVRRAASAGSPCRWRRLAFLCHTIFLAGGRYRPRRGLELRIAACALAAQVEPTACACVLKKGRLA